MIAVYRDLQRSSSPNPLLEQGHQESVAQDQAQPAFEYLQAESLHSLPGLPVPMLSHPHSKNHFLMFRWSLLCFSLCPLHQPFSGCSSSILTNTLFTLMGGRVLQLFANFGQV